MRDLPIDPPMQDWEVEDARRYAEWKYERDIDRVLAQDAKNRYVKDVEDDNRNDGTDKE